MCINLLHVPWKMRNSFVYCPIFNLGNGRNVKLTGNAYSDDYKLVRDNEILEYINIPFTKEVSRMFKKFVISKVNIHERKVKL